ncbi:MAG TPA: hypothetical protein VEK32_10340 [Thermodesulfobacteriota bacterium]|nr:hypothetical protein [Thermodesulfobacteriota bacterium]
MVCQGGMVECIPAGETTTATTCGEVRDGTTAQYLMVMFEPTGKAGRAVDIGGINRIEALLAATVREWRPVGTFEALDRRQDTSRRQWLQWLLARLLILARIKVPLQARTEEAMHEFRAIVVSKAARACLQKREAVRVRGMLAVPVKG